MMPACPCGNGAYDACCRRFHDGAAAPDAERLMRSRYSAYALGLTDYVHRTWHASTRPPMAELAHDADARWIGLEIRPQANPAVVEFIARYKVGGRAHRLHEVSRFVHEDGRWFYLDGSFPQKQDRK